MPDSSSTLSTRWLQCRKQIDKSRCKGFDCLVILWILCLQTMMLNFSSTLATWRLQSRKQIDKSGVRASIALSSWWHGYFGRIEIGEYLSGFRTCFDKGLIV
jgi:hypothetical protein